MTYQLITTDEALADACKSFMSCHLLAVDTEFKRETTYFPKPCLIQLAANKNIICIDPFQIKNLLPLRELLCNEHIIKVLHAGRQDIEVFNQLLDCSPTPLFDTQIAAGLLGYPSQIGYSTLVKSLFNKEIDKTLTRTNWEKRPLSKAELDYAAADVEYLEDIYEIFHHQLSQFKRLDWLTEEIDDIFHDNIYQDSLHKVWKKMCSSTNLNQTQRNVLFALNQWRENEAKTRDRARQFVISNEVMAGIAIQLPQNLNQLKLIDRIPRPVINRYSNDILKIVNDDATQTLDIPEVAPYERLDPEQSALLKQMKAEVESAAAELNIESTLLCNKKTLEKMVKGKNDNKLLHGWRYEIIGKRLKTIQNASV